MTPGESLALKLVVTPALIGAASLAGRRWGQGVSGWIVGLPLTSGPVAFFLAVDHGAAFAAAAAVGSMVGTIAQAGFCLGYGRLAFRVSWPLALLVGVGVFAAAAVAFQGVSLTLIWLFPVTLFALGVVIRLMPKGEDARRATPLPSWDIPARMVITTAIVLLLTGFASILGPRLSGLLATFPVYAGILTVFAHELQGPGPAVQVLRGLLFGLFSFAAFFFVLGLLIVRVGLAPAFGAAIAAALLLQAGSFRVIRTSATKPTSGRT
jgi:hypothetical protein